MTNTNTRADTPALHPAETLITLEPALESQGRNSIQRLDAEAVEALIESPWAAALVQERAAEILQQQLRTETNAARASLGRSPKYVPPVRDLNLVRRLDLAINEAARCVAHELVDQWRAEGAHANRWPTITGVERQ